MDFARSVLRFELVTPAGIWAVERDPAAPSAEFVPQWNAADSSATTAPDSGTTAVRRWISSGQDTVIIKATRPSPPAEQALASATVRDRRIWFNVAAPEVALQAAAAGADPKSLESLSLSSLGALRTWAMEHGRDLALWLIGRERSDVICLHHDGRTTAAECDLGAKHLVDCVQAELGLHFRASAHDLVFGEEHAWDETAAPIAEAFTAEVVPLVRPVAPQAELVILGLGAQLAELERAIAGALGLKRWSGPVGDDLARRGWSFGSTHGRGRQFDAMDWILACVAAPLGDPLTHRANFGGAPAAWIDPQPTNAPATAAIAAVDPRPVAIGTVAAPIETVHVATATPPPPATAPTVAAPNPLGVAELATATAKPSPDPTATPSKHSRGRKRRLTREAREELRQEIRDRLRKWVFVVIYTAIVATVGYYLMGKPADPAPIVR